MCTSSTLLEELAAHLMANPIAVQSLSGSLKLKVNQAGQIQSYLFDFQNGFNFQSDFNGESQATIILDSEVLRGLKSGELNGQRAFLEGLIKVEGDLDLVRQFSVFLGEVSCG